MSTVAARRARLALARPAARTAAGLSRLLRRGEGAVLGGRVALLVAPDAIAILAAGHDVAVVSATNGKTTTARLLAESVRAARPETALNGTGANLPSGIVTTLLDTPVDAPVVLEVDERYVDRTLTQLAPQVVVLGNLTRDQLDRTAEVRLTGGRWRAALAARPQTRVVANADDPVVVWAAQPADVTWVGLPGTSLLDAASCPSCGAPIEPGRDHSSADGDEGDDGGGWHCIGCDLTRPKLDAWLDGDELVDRNGERAAIHLTLDGRAARANASLAAIAARYLVGGTLAERLAPMATVTDVHGRQRRLFGPDHSTRLILAKNPVSLAESVALVAEHDRPVVIAINDYGPDGRDPSWLWDVDFRALAGRPVCATGRCATDLATRLAYAEVWSEPEHDLDRAVEWARRNQADVIATYTAFESIRRRQEASRA